MFIRNFLFSSVSETMPLYDILNEFQKGHSHIAVVYKDLDEQEQSPETSESGIERRKNKKTKDELFKDSCRKPKAQFEVSEKEGMTQHDLTTFHR